MMSTVPQAARCASTAEIMAPPHMTVRDTVEWNISLSAKPRQDARD